MIDAIAEKNSIADINRIYVGEQLTIPTSNDSSATTESNTTENTASTTETATQEHTYVAPVETVEVAPAAPAAATAPTSSSAKEWIAQKESGGSYTATNGRWHWPLPIRCFILKRRLFSCQSRTCSRTIRNISLWFMGCC